MEMNTTTAQTTVHLARFDTTVDGEISSLPGRYLGSIDGDEIAITSAHVPGVGDRIRFALLFDRGHGWELVYTTTDATPRELYPSLGYYLGRVRRVAIVALGAGVAIGDL